jgi:hypothetical protein
MAFVHYALQHKSPGYELPNLYLAPISALYD